MNFGEMAELADALHSKCSAARHVGSHPTLATRVCANGGTGRRNSSRGCREKSCVGSHPTSRTIFLPRWRNADATGSEPVAGDGVSVQIGFGAPDHARVVELEDTVSLKVTHLRVRIASRVRFITAHSSMVERHLDMVEKSGRYRLRRPDYCRIAQWSSTGPTHRV